MTIKERAEKLCDLLGFAFDSTTINIVADAMTEAVDQAIVESKTGLTYEQIARIDKRIKDYRIEPTYSNEDNGVSE